jgi:hypothetical protein
MTFAPWAVRLGASSDVVTELRRRLAEAPQGVLDFLRPEGVGDEMTFALTEAIILGRKDDGYRPYG